MFLFRLCKGHARLYAGSFDWGKTKKRPGLVHLQEGKYFSMFYLELNHSSRRDIFCHFLITPEVKERKTILEQKDFRAETILTSRQHNHDYTCAKA